MEFRIYMFLQTLPWNTNKSRSHPSMNGCPVCRGPLTGRSIVLISLFFIKTVTIAFTFQAQVDQFHNAIQNVTRPTLSPSLSSNRVILKYPQLSSNIIDYPQLSSTIINYHQSSSTIFNYHQSGRATAMESLAIALYKWYSKLYKFPYLTPKNISSHKIVVSAQKYVPFQLIW